MSSLGFARLSLELRQSALEFALVEIRQLLRHKPELTATEVVAALESQLEDYKGTQSDEDLLAEECARCGRQILVKGNDFVTHISAAGGLNRGCRAASFDPDNGWDDSLPRSWYAKRSSHSN